MDGRREVRKQRLMCLLFQVFICQKTLWTVSEGWVWCNLELRGMNYMGSLNVTQHGVSCQNWALETPHQVKSDIRDESFPEGSKQEAKNYCRNPDTAEKYTIWCYTQDPVKEWDYCLACPDNSQSYNSCKLPNKGAYYTGAVSFTRTQYECDPWVKHLESTFSFVDGTAAEASNFCRNPDSTVYQGPWCFIKGEEGNTWDYCDVCLPFRGGISKQEGVYEAHKKNMLDDKQSVHSCLHWCINYLSCVSVDFDKKSNRCYFHAATEAKKTEDGDFDHYRIQRICREGITEGVSGYYTIFPKSQFQGVLLIGLDATWKKCEYLCSRQPACVFIEMSFTGHCYSSSTLYADYKISEVFDTKVITRCHPNLQPKEVVGKAMLPLAVEKRKKKPTKAKPVAKTDLSADEGFEAAKPSSSSKKKSASKSSDDDAASSSSSTANRISMMVIEMTFIGLVSSAYGFLKTRRQNEEIQRKLLAAQLRRRKRS